MNLDISPSSSRVPRHSPHLARNKVVRSALTLLDDVGFEGLTLRKLADRLGVKAAALYWHFDNKQDLINHVASEILREEIRSNPLPEGIDWQAVLMRTAHASRNAFRRYRDGALTIARADLSKTEIFQAQDVITQRLLAADMPPELAADGFYAISRYTLGCVLEEQAHPQPATVICEQQFAQGLQLIIDGVAAQLMRQKSHA